MSRYGLKNLIEQADKAMALIRKGSDEYMAIWRIQAKAKVELVKLERLNQLNAYGFELALKQMAR